MGGYRLWINGKSKALTEFVIMNYTQYEDMSSYSSFSVHHNSTPVVNNFTLSRTSHRYVPKLGLRSE